MLENGAPPNIFGVLYHLFHIEVHGFNRRIVALEVSHFGSWYYLNFFTEGMGPFNSDKQKRDILFVSYPKALQIDLSSSYY